MRKFQCLLFVLKRTYISYYIICMTVPLIIQSLNCLFCKYACIISKKKLLHNLLAPEKAQEKHKITYHTKRG